MKKALLYFVILSAINSACAIDTNEAHYADINASREAERLVGRAEDEMRKENYPQAKEFYERAIKLGSSKASYGLARMYQEGIGVQRDDKRAQELLMIKEEQRKNR